jgi:hypothetical protein
MTEVSPESNGIASTKEVDIERRDVLAEWVGARVTITGTLATINNNKHPTKQFLVALIDAAWVTLPTKARHYLGHLWIQRAENLRGVHSGTRVSFEATVHSYQQTIPGTTQKRTSYGLRFPSEPVVLPDPPVFPSVVAEAPATKPEPKPIAPPAMPDPIETVTKLRDTILAAGGSDKIKSVLATVNQAGGWPAVEAVRELVNGLGGEEKIITVLDLLKV